MLFNLDNKIDLTDFGLQSFSSPRTHAQGDVDGDGDVDLNDSGILKESVGVNWTNV